MSSESMRGHEPGKKNPKLDKEQLRKKRNEDAVKREVAMFREVFGPPSARSEAQKYVMDRFAYYGYYDRGLSFGGCNDQEFYAREGKRLFFLWIKDLANRPIDQKPKQPTEIDRSGFNVNTK